MNDVLNIFFAPTKVFEKIKEKPSWFKPLIIVLIVIAITTAFTVYLTKDAALVRQEEALRERGMTDEQIEQAQQMIGSPIFIVLGAISAVVMIVIMLLIFSLLVNILVPVFGGTGSFKHVFSVACSSALIRIPSSIIRLILIALTKSMYVSASLALLVPSMDKMSFVYRVLAGFDLFIIWEMVLVAIGISVTNRLSKKNAYILVGLIFILSVFVGAVLAGLGGRRG